MKAQAFVDHQQRRVKRDCAPPTGKHRHISKAERARAAAANRLPRWSDYED